MAATPSLLGVEPAEADRRLRERVAEIGTNSAADELLQQATMLALAVVPARVVAGMLRKLGKQVERRAAGWPAWGRGDAERPSKARAGGTFR